MKNENVPQMEIIAKIHSGFSDKFGIPRQSGLVEGLTAKIVFEPKFRNADAIRGIEGFSHLWLIWLFSETVREGFSATVRPPRLGGNTRMGVFATRSPFRPNPIGLSSVKLEKIESDKENGLTLIVSGADLMDGTPILDIKPYLPISDCHDKAVGGFSDEHKDERLRVDISSELLCKIPVEIQCAVVGLLAENPCPSYQSDPNRMYKMKYSQMEVHFKVEAGVLTVCEILTI